MIDRGADVGRLHSGLCRSELKKTCVRDQWKVCNSIIAHRAIHSSSVRVRASLRASSLQYRVFYILHYQERSPSKIKANNKEKKSGRQKSQPSKGKSFLPNGAS
jgi:hypothetical protein